MTEAYAVLRPWASAVMAIGPTRTIHKIGRQICSDQLPARNVQRGGNAPAGRGAGNQSLFDQVAPLTTRGDYKGRPYSGPPSCGSRRSDSLLSEHSRCNFLCHRESLAIQRIVAAFSLAAANDKTAVSHELLGGAPERNAGPFSGPKQLGSQNAFLVFELMIPEQEKQHRIRVLVGAVREHFQRDGPVLAKIKNA